MNNWDWHYRIFFDQELSDQAKKWECLLSREQAAIFQKTREFYLSFYSIDQLLTQINTYPERCDSILNHAVINKHLLITTPQLLVRHYDETIKHLNIPGHQKDALFSLLALSEKGVEILPYYWDYQKYLWGDNSKDLIKTINNDEYSLPIRLPRQKHIKENLLTMFNCIYQELTKNEELQKAFGSSAIQSFEKKIIHGTSYGEWWDREQTSDKKDHLILFTDNSTVKQNDFLYTIIHETYPGHGHFYNYIRNPNTLMDFGANLLIEGWATYCEWHSLPSTYADSTRHNGIVYLHDSNALCSNDLSNQIWLRKKMSRMPFQKTIPVLINATQRIGLMESYYAGALWFENVFNLQSLMSPCYFLDHLKKINKGEFFRLWL